MREIKFRGMIVDFENKWTYGDLISTDPYRIVDLIDGTDLYVYENTIGQYIGLKDKNDAENEGDIVKVIDIYPNIRTIGVVGFQDGSFMIKNDCITHYRWMDYELEVIGNIYENKELLY